MSLNLTAAHSSRIKKPTSASRQKTPFASFRRAKAASTPTALHSKGKQLEANLHQTEERSRSASRHSTSSSTTGGDVLFDEALPDLGPSRAITESIAISSVTQAIQHIQSTMFSAIPERRSGMNSTRIAQIMAFRKSLPPIVSVAHVHVLLDDPTKVEREIVQLVDSAVVRRLLVTGRGDGTYGLGDCLVLLDDWEKLVRNSTSLDDVLKGEILPSFLSDIYSCIMSNSCIDRFIEALRKETKSPAVPAGFFSAEETAALVRSGFLVTASSHSKSGYINVGRSTTSPSANRAVHSSSERGSTMILSLPNMGPYLRLLGSARTQILDTLRKSRYSEAPLYLIRDRWDGSIELSSRVSIAKHIRGEFAGVLPGRTNKWKQLHGLNFQWALEEALAVLDKYSHAAPISTVIPQFIYSNEYATPVRLTCGHDSAFLNIYKSSTIRHSREALSLLPLCLPDVLRSGGSFWLGLLLFPSQQRNRRKKKTFGFNVFLPFLLFSLLGPRSLINIGVYIYIYCYRYFTDQPDSRLIAPVLRFITPFAYGTFPPPPPDSDEQGDSNIPEQGDVANTSQPTNSSAAQPQPRGDGEATEHASGPQAGISNSSQAGPSTAATEPSAEVVAQVDVTSPVPVESSTEAMGRPSEPIDPIGTSSTQAETSPAAPDRPIKPVAEAGVTNLAPVEPPTESIERPSERLVLTGITNPTQPETSIVATEHHLEPIRQVENTNPAPAESPRATESLSEPVAHISTSNPAQTEISAGPHQPTETRATQTEHSVAGGRSQTVSAPSFLASGGIEAPTDRSSRQSEPEERRGRARYRGEQPQRFHTPAAGPGLAITGTHGEFARLDPGDEPRPHQGVLPDYAHPRPITAAQLPPCAAFRTSYNVTAPEFDAFLQKALDDAFRALCQRGPSTRRGERYPRPRRSPGCKAKCYFAHHHVVRDLDPGWLDELRDHRDEIPRDAEEDWFGRKSEHKDRASRGNATFEDMRQYWKNRHTTHLPEYVPGIKVTNIHTYDCEDVQLVNWRDVTAESEYKPKRNTSHPLLARLC
ncbi:hypothetical protein TRV_00770 [Trichophyton verrucosum HKI 0517]|uniref:Uncharacterized protein n=1 Tax=Trichophyton verrucosum (strain HKI 0517) TaxID=663202 RepID=D4D124_TRIVH|nr:uncharacterized protein TRV_00770 [Trichophyton verrucosum HKI 0517]EFE44501.1 hypothetical protein TRV_00770 [Trichophyton verrucosum HKI 0517]